MTMTHAAVTAKLEREYTKEELDAYYGQQEEQQQQGEQQDAVVVEEQEEVKVDPSVPPPKPPRTASMSGRGQLSGIEYQLRQAMAAKDVTLLNKWITAAEEANMDASDSLLVDAKLLYKELQNSDQVQQLETIKHYLKQGIEMKKRELLEIALDKAKKMHASSRLYSEFNELVVQAEALLAQLQKENVETIKFYLKQGIQLRNRDMLKETMDKARALPPDAIDEDLMHKAAERLRRLDAEHLIIFYLENATKAKDLEALQSALAKANALQMKPDTPELVKANEVRKTLLEKKRKSGAKRGIRSLFGGKSKRGGGDDANKLFGGPLAEACKRSPYEVPKIMYMCIEYLSREGLHTQGLFRVPGSKDAMVVLRQQFSDDDSDIKLDDIHDTAGVLKQYLRALPEPLIPFSSYPEYLKVAHQSSKTNDPARLKALRDLIAKLPQPNREALRFLCYFLHDLSLHEKDNKMNVNNIAIVFAPNLLRPEVETHETMMNDMPVTISVIASIIESPDACFDDGRPESLRKINQTPTATTTQ
eukprot:TRINITY_DN67056_c5_g4_i1.p1 TRINITY_DN67056_c5_g4~~TRINITY_DN67056_c5_g4_i1.p1  ORF type:complete len:533 (-),score=334.39 TRINITY_DN67056_c5_g4_i1:25-1623(-)